MFVLIITWGAKVLQGAGHLDYGLGHIVLRVFPMVASSLPTFCNRKAEA